MTKKASSTDPYGWRHQKRRRVVKAKLQDGELCWWCGRPMHHTHDIHADHAVSVRNGGTKAARPMHGACNEQRRQGGPEIDRRRPAGGAPDAYRMLPIRLAAGGVDTRYPTTGHSTLTAAHKPTAHSFQWG